MLLMETSTFEWFKEWREFETVQRVREIEEEVRRTNDNFSLCYGFVVKFLASIECSYDFHFKKIPPHLFILLLVYLISFLVCNSKYITQDTENVGCRFCLYNWGIAKRLWRKNSPPHALSYILPSWTVYMASMKRSWLLFASSFNLAISSCRNKHETLSICLPDSLSDSANLTLKFENIKPNVKLFESGLFRLLSGLF